MGIERCHTFGCFKLCPLVTLLTELISTRSQMITSTSRAAYSKIWDISQLPRIFTRDIIPILQYPHIINVSSHNNNPTKLTILKIQIFQFLRSMCHERICIIFAMGNFAWSEFETMDYWITKPILYSNRATARWLQFLGNSWYCKIHATVDNKNPRKTSSFGHFNETLRCLFCLSLHSRQITSIFLILAMLMVQCILSWPAAWMMYGTLSPWLWGRCISHFHEF